ncbi:hypothetical protein C7974DRAFT_448580 [Boeremia exigua]|uniref:uncharacterized protein n=1 Tax=Boeremia exigua TaxID=749465 RepID=UPI001E8E5B9B|nr:uncharacterized protein C7974DRAFT_448580 [Boeremia exigua]KAH6638844.1 hypothetical protein C7974DRAFT_448580 [Boeremia exigua]
MTTSGIGQVVSWYICTVAAVPFVCLRTYTRWAKFGGLAIEDGFIILALLCLIGDLAIQQHMWNLGLGDIAKGTLTPDKIKGIMQMIVPGSTLYVASLWAVKLALVLFYKRLAAPGSKLITVYNIALGGLLVTFLVIFFDILFQCYPYDKRWSADPDYQCDPKAADINYWITILFNIISDAIIITLPIVMVMRLQMKLKQKLGVAAIFALGIFVIISSIIRAYYSRLNETMLTCTVSMVETSIAIIASCLPALRSMLIGGNTQNATSSYGKHYELTTDKRKTNAHRLNGHTASVMSPRRTRHSANDSEDSLVTGGISVQSGDPSLSNDKSGIHVETTIATDYVGGGESTKSAV